MLYTVTGTLLAVLAFVIFQNINTSSSVNYNASDENNYDSYVHSGDSLYKLASDVRLTDNAHLAPDIYKSALENYLAAQSISKENQTVRRRIKEIEAILQSPPDEDLFDERTISLTFLRATPSYG